MKYRVVLKNLPHCFTHQDLLYMGIPFGEVVGLWCSQTTPNNGFLDFDCNISAESAVEVLNGTLYDGNRIEACLIGSTKTTKEKISRKAVLMEPPKDDFINKFAVMELSGNDKFIDRPLFPLHSALPDDGSVEDVMEDVKEPQRPDWWVQLPEESKKLILDKEMELPKEFWDKGWDSVDQARRFICLSILGI